MINILQVDEVKTRTPLNFTWSNPGLFHVPFNTDGILFDVGPRQMVGRMQTRVLA